MNTSIEFINPITVVIKENECLRAEISDLKALYQREEAQLTAKLGTTEYELEQSQASHESALIECRQELVKIQEENEELRFKLTENEAKLGQRDDVIKAQNDRINKTRLYLSKLPSNEEYNNSLVKLRQTIDQLASTENDLASCRKELDASQTLTCQLSEQVKRHKSCQQLLQTQLDAALERLSDRRQINGKGIGSKSVTPEFIEDVQFELDRLRVAYRQMEKLCEAESHRASSIDGQSKMQRSQLEERLAREEATIVALRASLSTRRGELDQLKKLLASVNVEKQDLIAELADCRLTLSRSDQAWRSTSSGIKQRRLADQLTSGIAELDHLTDQLSRLASGQPINVAQLLTCSTASVGSLDAPLVDLSNEALKESRQTDQSIKSSPQTTASSTTPNLTPALVPTNWLDTQSGQVKAARTKLDSLRQQLVDAYADRIGSSVNCRVQ